MADDDKPPPPPSHNVPTKDSYEPPEGAWWMGIPGASVAVLIDMIWQSFFPHTRADAELQFCHYYHFGPVPKGKHARIKISGNEARAPEYGAIEVFVTPVGQPLPPAAGTAPRVTLGGDGETSVYGGGMVTLHQAKAFPVPAPLPTKARVTIEGD